MKKKLLIVDDDKDLLESLYDFFLPDFDVEISNSQEEGIQKVNSGIFDIAIIDMNMNQDSEGGLRIVKFIDEHKLKTKPIVFTAYGSIDNVKSAYKKKIFDYVEKGLPESRAELLASVYKASNAPNNKFQFYLSEKENNLLSELLPAYNNDLNQIIVKGLNLVKSNNKSGIDCIFIAHGNNKEWREVETYIKDELKFKVLAYETESHSVEFTHEAIENLLDKCNFAVIVMSDDDYTKEGKARARQNVIHEMGLFQGRYGHKRVIVMKKKSVELNSNLIGKNLIEYHNNIDEGFHKLKKALGKKI